MFTQAASLHSTRLPASFFARFSAPGTGTVTYTIETELSCEVQLIDCGRTRVPALAKTPFNCAGTGVITCPNYLALTCRQIARPGVEPGRRQTTTLVEIASALGTSSRQHRPCQRERPEHKHTTCFLQAQKECTSCAISASARASLGAKTRALHLCTASRRQSRHGVAY